MQYYSSYILKKSAAIEVLYSGIYNANAILQYLFTSNIIVITALDECTTNIAGKLVITFKMLSNADI